jgi:hypothetical protein
MYAKFLVLILFSYVLSSVAITCLVKSSGPTLIKELARILS